MFVSRNTINQLVALVVFLCLSYYAYTNDMLFKADPAVPLKTRPKKEKSESYYLFPSFPAIYVSAESAEVLQNVYDTDAAALDLTRRMTQSYLKHNTPPKATQPVFVDVGSPYGTWGLYTSAIGAHTQLLQPRKNGPERPADSLRFNRINTIGRITQRFLAKDRMRLVYSAGDGSWKDKDASGKDFVTQTAPLDGYISDHFPIMMVHLGVESAVLNGLQGVLHSIQEGRVGFPMSLMLDFPTGQAKGLAYTTGKMPDGRAAVQKEEGETMGKVLAELVRLGGYTVAMLPQEGCLMTKDENANTTLFGHTLYRIEADAVEKVSAQAAELMHAQGSHALCRVLLYHDHEFNRVDLPIFFICAVFFKFLCVAVMCCRRRRKSAERIL